MAQKSKSFAVSLFIPPSTSICKWCAIADIACRVISTQDVINHQKVMKILSGNKKITEKESLQISCDNTTRRYTKWILVINYCNLFLLWILRLLKTLKYGLASTPQPATHCQLALLLARSASKRFCQNQRSPSFQCKNRFFVKKDPTIILTRLCMYPVDKSCLIPASTIG